MGNCVGITSGDGFPHIEPHKRPCSFYFTYLIPLLTIGGSCIVAIFSIVAGHLLLWESCEPRLDQWLQIFGWTSLASMAVIILGRNASDNATILWLYPFVSGPLLLFSFVWLILGVVWSSQASGSCPNLLIVCVLVVCAISLFWGVLLLIAGTLVGCDDCADRLYYPMSVCGLLWWPFGSWD